MQPLPIIVHLHVFKQNRLGFSPAGEHLVSHAFNFERGEETFHHRIVITIAGATHADLQLMSI